MSYLTLMVCFSVVVTVELTGNTGTVKEGEGHHICISLDQEIARQIDLLLQIQVDTADLSE